MVILLIRHQAIAENITQIYKYSLDHSMSMMAVFSSNGFYHLISCFVGRLENI